MAFNVITKLIKAKYPSYDEHRYHFRFGDIIRHRGAKLLAIQSLITECEFIALSNGFGFKKMDTVKFSYDELPYYKKGEFVSLPYRIKYSYDVGTFFNSREGVVLITENTPKYVVGLCLNNNSYYFKQKICI